MADVKTMADLARLAGVSPSTVSRALNDNPAIPKVTRSRILALAAQHNYRVNVRARALRLQRSHTVAAVFPQSEGSTRLMTDPFYLEIMGAISDELSTHGYDLLVSLSRGETDWYQRYVIDGRADGLLILERDTEARGVRQLTDVGVPFVAWGPTLPGQQHVSVGGDSFKGALLAVKHLIARNRKTIGFIGGDRTMIETQQRFAGYQAALSEAGLPFRSRLISYTDYTPRQASTALGQLLEVEPQLDAIFFCSDVMAVTSYETLRQAGRRIPEDVAVIGYDDIPLASYAYPRLTTIRQEVVEGGRLMVRKLLALLAGETVISEMLPVTLQLRESA
jgi:DNA-binding LacI/PurR family transcriptional regulator